MKIISLEYENRTTQWKLLPTTFGNLTLLVGVSGVGKTQILKSILDLKKIANGESLNGVKWNIKIKIGKDEYTWKGEFEYKTMSLEEHLLEEIPIISRERRYKIKSESLRSETEELVNRNEGSISFKGNKTPKLSGNKSILELFNGEDSISVIQSGFNKVIDVEAFSPIPHSFLAFSLLGDDDFKSMLKKHDNLEKIKSSSLPLELKLALVYKNEPKAFNEIKEHFIEIFSQVEDIRVEPLKNKASSLLSYPLLQIKEKNVEKWILPNRISSGMRKTLAYLSYFYLSSEETVILIDQFENSLGVNCINVLRENLITNSLQFIITSHHPYIINNIKPEFWKLVTRRGGVVSTHSCSELGFGRSHHKAFIQLINNDFYTEGIQIQ